MNRTLTKEQIQKIWDRIITGHAGAKEIDTICDLALNSIPKAFDPEDETTWPEKENREYLVWVLIDDPKISKKRITFPCVLHFIRGRWWEDPYSSGFKDGAPEIEGEIDQSNSVTHYMPIPEAGEDK